MINSDSYRGYNLGVVQDSDCCESSREWDNLGAIICWHRRDWFGDSTVGQRQHAKQSGCKYYFDSQEDLKAALDSGAYIFRPVYLYQHSGESVSCFPFGDRFDSGQVGYIIVSKQDIYKEYGVKRVSARVRALVLGVLKSEVDCYNQYLTGDIWGYQITGPGGESLDSCWGFYGLDDCYNEARAVVDSYLQDVESAAWAAVPVGTWDSVCAYGG
jgi:hypothetical protein